MMSEQAEAFSKKVASERIPMIIETLCDWGERT
jgi:hypothetical protein